MFDNTPIEKMQSAQLLVRQSTSNLPQQILEKIGSSTGPNRTELQTLLKNAADALISNKKVTPSFKTHYDG